MAKEDKKEKRTSGKNSQDVILLDVTPNLIDHKIYEIGLTVFSKKTSLNMSLQWGAASEWETIRVIQTESTKALYMGNVLRRGDGTKRFRLLIENETNIDAQYFYWIDTVLV
jgi:hypothetical protein